MIESIKKLLLKYDAEYDEHYGYYIFSTTYETNGALLWFYQEQTVQIAETVYVQNYDTISYSGVTSYDLTQHNLLDIIDKQLNILRNQFFNSIKEIKNHQMKIKIKSANSDFK
jgi:hypothetical protein